MAREENGLTREEANGIYDILVQHAGEQEDEDSREDFIYHQMNEFQREYRFMGALGFGGKFRRRYDDVWFVDAYSEDLNPERREMIKVTNEALARFQEKMSK